MLYLNADTLFVCANIRGTRSHAWLNYVLEKCYQIQRMSYYRISEENKINSVMLGNSINVALVPRLRKKFISNHLDEVIVRLPVLGTE